jgi:hypothetical protein
MRQHDQKPEHLPLKPSPQTREQFIRETESFLNAHLTGAGEFEF